MNLKWIIRKKFYRSRVIVATNNNWDSWTVPESSVSYCSADALKWALGQILTVKTTPISLFSVKSLFRCHSSTFYCVIVILASRISRDKITRIKATRWQLLDREKAGLEFAKMMKKWHTILRSLFCDRVLHISLISSLYGWSSRLKVHLWRYWTSVPCRWMHASLTNKIFIRCQYFASIITTIDGQY